MGYIPISDKGLSYTREIICTGSDLIHLLISCIDFFNQWKETVADPEGAEGAMTPLTL